MKIMDLLVRELNENLPDGVERVTRLHSEQLIMDDRGTWRNRRGQYVPKTSKNERI